MKQCPQCRTTYTDDTLIYCLSDGSVLAEKGPIEQETFVQGGDPAPPAPAHFRIDIPQEGVAAGSHVTADVKAEGNGLKIALVLGLVLLMLIGAAAFAAALIYFNKDSRPIPKSTPNANAQEPANSRSVSNANGPPAANTETDKLREQIANLEKRLDEQKTSSASPNIPTEPDEPALTHASPVVNSPGDGFLALRSLPSSDIGDRVVRIPNGAHISISGCLPRSRVGSKTGRWCKASYNGYSGWVFDAWLIY